MGTCLFGKVDHGHPGGINTVQSTVLGSIKTGMIGIIRPSTRRKANSIQIPQAGQLALAESIAPAIVPIPMPIAVSTTVVVAPTASERIANGGNSAVAATPRKLINNPIKKPTAAACSATIPTSQPRINTACQPVKQIVLQKTLANQAEGRHGPV